MNPWLSRLCLKQPQPVPDLQSQIHSTPQPLRAEAATGSCTASRESLPPPLLPQSHQHLLREARCLPVASTGLVFNSVPRFSDPSPNDLSSTHAELIPPSSSHFIYCMGRTSLSLECAGHVSHPGYAGILMASNIPFSHPPFQRTREVLMNIGNTAQIILNFLSHSFDFRNSHFLFF